MVFEKSAAPPRSNVARGCELQFMLQVNVTLVVLTDGVVRTFFQYNTVCFGKAPDGVLIAFTWPTTNPMDPICTELQGRRVNAGLAIQAPGRRTSIVCPQNVALRSRPPSSSRASTTVIFLIPFSRSVIAAAIPETPPPRIRTVVSCAS